MRNINKMLKGVAFLMCLGFLAFAGNADAKTTTKSIMEKIDKLETSYKEYGVTRCTRAEGYIGQYNSKEQECAGLRAQASQAKAADKAAANQAVKTCENDRDKFLKQANDAVKECESTAKAAKKAKENADKKDKDLGKKNEEAAAAQTALTKAETAYNDACVGEGKDPESKNCQKLYKAYEKAAKDAGKKAKAAAKAQSQANSANEAAASASETAHRSSCPDGQVWKDGECKNPEIFETDLGAAGVGSTDAGSENDLQNAQQDAAASVKARETCSQKLGLQDGVSDGFSIFKLIACKIMVLIADLRVIVYILSGFGLIAFAYGAIIGKINFKQLANIAIGLFILSMTTSFIEYFAYDGRKGSLAFGDFLPDGNHAKYMSNYTQEECANNPDLCPDVALSGAKDAAENSSWSWKDLKSSISSARDAIKTASNTVKTVQNNVRNVTNAVSNIGNAIKNGGDPFTMVNNIVAGVSQISGAVTNTAGALASGASSLSNSLQDMTSSQEQLAYRQQLETEYNRLKAKCDHGNCSENEKNALANLQTQMNNQTTGIDKYLANDGKGGGSTILDSINKVNNMAGQAANATNQMQAATSMGQEVFGDNTLGAILGAANGLAEGYSQTTDFIENNKNNGNMDFRSEQTKAEDTKKQQERANKNSCAAQGLNFDEATGKCVGKTKDGNSNVESDVAGTTRTTTRTNENGDTYTHTQGSDGHASSSLTTYKKDKDGNIMKDDKGNPIVDTTSTYNQNPDGGDTIVTSGNGHIDTKDRDADGKTTSHTTDGRQDPAVMEQTCKAHKLIYCKKTGNCVKSQSDCKS